MTRRTRRARAWSLRTVVFWIHLAVGVAAGLVVLVMAATGVALAYERQILAWAAGASHVAPPSVGAVKLPLDTLLLRAQAAAGEKRVVALALGSAVDAPLAATLEDRRTLLLDPYTAQVVGSDSSARPFFTAVERLHRSLALSGGARSPVGTAITGASNLAFLFLILSGFYLWWPRRLTVRAFRAGMVLRLRLSGKARDWNWHNVLGFWSAPALALIVAAGVFISYQWPMKLLNTITGAPAAREGAPGGELVRREGQAGGERRGGEQRGSEQRGSEQRGGEQRGGEQRGGEQRGGEQRGGAPGGPNSPLTGPPWSATAHASLDGMVALVSREAPEWRTLSIRFPRTPKQPVTLALSTSESGRPDRRETLLVDGRTGELKDVQTYAKFDLARKIRMWVRPVHTGEAAGVLGQTIAALVSAAAVVLVVTGITLSIRRLLASLSRGRREAPPEPLREVA